MTGMEHAIDRAARAEAWRPVVGFEGLYEVSDHGRVRSLDREVKYSNGKLYIHQGRILRHGRHRTGHLYVRLCRNGEKSYQHVHRLVLGAFVGPCPPGMVGCHYDDDPDNNHVSNLRWDTESANQYDKVRNGNHHEARKTHCPRGHEYSEANTQILRTAKGGINRKCRTCRREAWHKRVPADAVNRAEGDGRAVL